VIGGRKDYKVDCLAADWSDWEISWDRDISADNKPSVPLRIYMSDKTSPYKDSLINAMTYLGNKDNTIFIGQQIVYAGNPEYYIGQCVKRQDD
jgi:hypothetical protein